jgi:hypothetical protein
MKRKPAWPAAQTLSVLDARKTPPDDTMVERRAAGFD